MLYNCSTDHLSRTLHDDPIDQLSVNDLLCAAPKNIDPSAACPGGLPWAIPVRPDMLSESERFAPNLQVRLNSIRTVSFALGCHCL